MGKDWINKMMVAQDAHKVDVHRKCWANKCSLWMPSTFPRSRLVVLNGEGVECEYTGSLSKSKSLKLNSYDLEIVTVETQYLP